MKSLVTNRSLWMLVGLTAALSQSAQGQPAQAASPYDNLGAANQLIVGPPFAYQYAVDEVKGWQANVVDYVVSATHESGAILQIFPVTSDVRTIKAKLGGGFSSLYFTLGKGKVRRRKNTLVVNTKATFPKQAGLKGKGRLVVVLPKNAGEPAIMFAMGVVPEAKKRLQDMKKFVRTLHLTKLPEPADVAALVVPASRTIKFPSVGVKLKTPKGWSAVEKKPETWALSHPDLGTGSVVMVSTHGAYHPDELESWIGDLSGFEVIYREQTKSSFLITANKRGEQPPKMAMFFLALAPTGGGLTFVAAGLTESFKRPRFQKTFMALFPGVDDYRPSPKSQTLTMKSWAHRLRVAGKVWPGFTLLKNEATQQSYVRAPFRESITVQILSEEDGRRWLLAPPVAGAKILKSRRQGAVHTAIRAYVDRQPWVEAVAVKFFPGRGAVGVSMLIAASQNSKAWSKQAAKMLRKLKITKLNAPPAMARIRARITGNNLGRSHSKRSFSGDFSFLNSTETDYYFCADGTYRYTYESFSSFSSFSSAGGRGTGNTTTADESNSHGSWSLVPIKNGVQLHFQPVGKKAFVQNIWEKGNRMVIGDVLMKRETRARCPAY